MYDSSWLLMDASGSSCPLARGADSWRQCSCCSILPLTWPRKWQQGNIFFFFLEVQVYMIKCNHYKPSLCAQSSVMEDEWKGDEQTNETNKQAEQKQNTRQRSVGGRMDDEGCRTWWCIDSWHGRSRFHENANFSKMTSENLRNKGAHLCPN